ncbi:MAG: hypothetical protein J6Q53_01305 [Oscillospiraceae bacterium]|nr:hypothetical protein [Oscillospiraceae bacterium]
MTRERLIRLIWILTGVLLALSVAAFLLAGKTPQNPHEQPTLSQSEDKTPESNEDTGGDTSTQETPGEADDSTETQLPTPDIFPDTIGLYIPVGDGTKDRELIGELQAKRTAKKDIDCFEAIASGEERLKGKSFSGIWNDAWNAHANTQDAKIGYFISFALQDGSVVEKILLKPSDGKDFYSYVEVYMYDDIHQTPGVRYSHLEDKDMEEDTIISSIKLTSGSKIAQVGDIRLTAFIYNDPRQVESGVYTGDVSATVVIPK